MIKQSIKRINNHIICKERREDRCHANLVVRHHPDGVASTVKNVAGLNMGYSVVRSGSNIKETDSNSPKLIQ